MVGKLLLLGLAVQPVLAVLFATIAAAKVPITGF
jgi:hypothetical protein